MQQQFLENSAEAVFYVFEDGNFFSNFNEIFCNSQVSSIEWRDGSEYLGEGEHPQKKKNSLSAEIRTTYLPNTLSNSG